MFAWFNNCLIRKRPVIDRYECLAWLYPTSLSASLFILATRSMLPPFLSLSLSSSRSFFLLPLPTPLFRRLTARSSSNSKCSTRSLLAGSYLENGGSWSLEGMSGMGAIVEPVFLLNLFFFEILLWNISFQSFSNFSSFNQELVKS